MSASPPRKSPRHKRIVPPQEGLTAADAREPWGNLDLSGNVATRTLPGGLVCDRIVATDSKLRRLGSGIACRELELDGSEIEAIPDGTAIAYRLSARDCHRLTALPAGLRLGILALQNCLALQALPARLSPAFLDLAGCSALESLPDDLDVRGGRLSIRDCPLIAALPTRGGVAQLDVSGCRKIAHVPEGFEVTSWIDIGGSSITALPAHLPHVGLRWRGVPIDARIAFRPHELGIEEILGERNAEVRRVMLERYGFETFMAAADAELLDADRDPGGERKLLRVELERDEPLVCVSVSCPSTARRYFLRVPPTMRTCRQAIAWTAGFDDPNDYDPRVET